jgi:hypothetical protein
VAVDNIQIGFLALNGLGGAAVLGSYVHGFRTHARPSDALWGGVPRWLRPWYGVSMLLAALGFFGFFTHLAFFVAPDAVLLPGGYGAYLVLVGLILAPSTLWMPLTFRYAARPGPGAWWAVRAVLMLVALGSAALLVALLATRPAPVTASWLAAVVGAGLFAFHVAVLDAILWPALYRRASRS